jgi:hypothetical protein
MTMTRTTGLALALLAGAAAAAAPPVALLQTIALDKFANANAVTAFSTMLVTTQPDGRLSYNRRGRWPMP